MSTKDWNIRVFLFIIALVEVNARLAWSHFSDMPPITQLEFRRLLAKELVEYSLQARGRRRKADKFECRSVCGEGTAPKFAGHWTGSEWTKLATTYPQRVCRTLNGNKRIRTYCRCKVSDLLDVLYLNPKAHCIKG